MKPFHIFASQSYKLTLVYKSLHAFSFPWVFRLRLVKLKDGIRKIVRFSFERWY